MVVNAYKCEGFEEFVLKLEELNSAKKSEPSRILLLHFSGSKDAKGGRKYNKYSVFQSHFSDEIYNITSLFL